jgi:glycosyltransferase involved in cell wall biosynthesis
MKSADQNQKPSLCIGILTLNEENNIVRCIRSASFADKILIVDSGSTDKTCEHAKALGAEVLVYDNWEGFAAQRNRLLEHCTTDYIFFLDADEEITPELCEEIKGAVQSGEDVICEIRWEQVAYGRSLKYMTDASGLPRLFKVSSIDRFEGIVHEYAKMKVANIPTRRFNGKLLHYSRETIHGSLLKLAQYSQLGAVKRAENNRQGGIWRGIASGSAVFIRLYFFRRVFLSGPQGFIFCLFVALESFFRYVSLKYDKDSLKVLVKR